MAQRFNLTAQLQLQAPANTRQVVGQIRKQLKDIGVDVKVKTNTRQVAQLNKELQGVSKAGTASAKSVQNLNATLAQSARRFSVITVATGSFLALARAIRSGVSDAVAFERELLKISQVTGKSVKQLQGLTSEVTRLSTSLGANSSELLNVSRTLAQAGFNADKTKRALQSLAQTTLAATFDSIQETTEGAIAVLRQFGAEASRTGGDIKFLGSTLDSINAVSKNFAVEAGDLITVIRRVGGVFSATGGSVNELIALFTSVRATTRESAETIATGLRTIFTRIQRTDTVDQLKQLGIELRNAQGQFVGAFEAVRRLSVGLSALDPRDARFSDIVEELGGFRQVGKVIPLIQQFTTAQNALAVAQNSAGSVARDAAIAQLGLGNQISKVKEEFSALIRQFADSSTFRSITTGALELAKAFIRIASALETALPLITTLVGLKIGRSLGAGLGGLLGVGGAQRRNQGGKIHAFARGGFVPGTGNRDTVPAMLTPGEFVIKKSSVKKLGAGQLHAMNQNRYNKAGKFEDLSKGKTFELGLAKELGVARQAALKKLGDKDGDSMFDIVGAFLQPTGIVDRVRALIQPNEISAVLSKSLGTKIGKGGTGLAKLAQLGVPELKSGLPIDIISGSTGTRAANKFRVDVRNKLSDAASTFNKEKGLPFAKNRFKAGYRKANPEQIEGNVFEAALASASGTPYNDQKDAANALIDFPQGLGKKTADFFGVPSDKPTDAKRTFNQAQVSSLVKKAASSYLNTYATQIARINVGEKSIPGFGTKEQKKLARKASGGGISGSDTVPALLTPGEFVINKSSAQSIGYANLSKMNQTGVQRFAAGGTVGAVQRFANGGPVSPGSGSSVPSLLIKSLQALDGTITKLDKSLKFLIRGFTLLDKETKNTTQDTKKLGDAEEKAAKQTGGRGGGVAGVAQRVDAVAGAAQSFVFLGASASALVAEFSSLEDKTKNAIQATVTQFSSLVGIIGTVTQIFTSIILARQQAAAAEAAEAAANQASILSEGAEATANTASATASSASASSEVVKTAANTASTESEAVKTAANAAATESEAVKTAANYKSAQSELQKQRANASHFSGVGGLGGAFAGLTLSTLGVMYVQNRAKEETRAFAEAARDAINKLKETGEGSAPAIAQAQEKAIAAEESELSTREMIGIYAGSIATSALVGAKVGAAVGAKTGAVGGTAVAGPAGTAGGAATGATAGAVVGGLAGGVAGTVAADQLVEKKRREAAEALKEFRDKILTAADAMVFTVKKQKEFEKGLEELNKKIFADTKEGKTQRIEERSARVQTGLESAAQAPFFQRLLSDIAGSLGKSLSQLKPEDIEDPGLRAQFELYKNTVEIAAESLESAARAADQNLREAMALEFTGEFSVEELLGQGGAFAKAFNDKIALIEQSNAAEEARLVSLLREAEVLQQIAQDSGEKLQIDAADKAEQAAANDLIKQRERASTSVEEFFTSMKESNQTSRDNASRQAQAAQAALELRQRLKALSDATVALNTFGRSVEDASIRLDNQIAAATGEQIKFRARGVRGRDEDTGQITDREKFDRSIGIAIASLPEEQKKGARLQADALRRQDRIFNEFQNTPGLLGRRVSSKETRPGKTAKDVATKIFEDAKTGIALNTAEADEAIRKLAKALQVPGGLSAEAFEEAFKGVRLEGEAADRYFDKLNDIRQKELDNNARYLDALADVRDKEIQARQNEIKVISNANELQAKARGGAVNIGAREQARTARAQAALRGTGIQAGNVGSASAALQRARAEQRRLAEIDQTGLDDPGKAKLQKEQARNIEIIKKATGELERLSDQSERAADILGEIEKERAKRETLTGIVEEFVVGDQDQRDAIMDAFDGIQLAVGTGTLQNQDAQGRKATVDMLDRLSDIEIPGAGGLTGKEVKQELIFRDAINMGLDPKTAQALATATSKEEKLINSMDRLTAVMERAAAALANDAAQQVAGFATGGVVPGAPGGPSPFPAKGTDTVPAMLTPGEFVIRKSAVDKIGVSNLRALNSGVQYRRGGGAIQYLQGGDEVKDEKPRLEDYPSNPQGNNDYIRDLNAYNEGQKSKPKTSFRASLTPIKIDRGDYKKDSVSFLNNQLELEELRKQTVADLQKLRESPEYQRQLAELRKPKTFNDAEAKRKRENEFRREAFASLSDEQLQALIVERKAQEEEDYRNNVRPLGLLDPARKEQEFQKRSSVAGFLQSFDSYDLKGEQIRRADARKKQQLQSRIKQKDEAAAQRAKDIQSDKVVPETDPLYDPSFPGQRYQEAVKFQGVKEAGLQRRKVLDAQIQHDSVGMSFEDNADRYRGDINKQEDEAKIRRLIYDENRKRDAAGIARLSTKEMEGYYAQAGGKTNFGRDYEAAQNEVILTDIRYTSKYKKNYRNDDFKLGTRNDDPTAEGRRFVRDEAQFERVTKARRDSRKRIRERTEAYNPATDDPIQAAIDGVKIDETKRRSGDVGVSAEVVRQNNADERAWRKRQSQLERQRREELKKTVGLKDPRLKKRALLRSDPDFAPKLTAARNKFFADRERERTSQRLTGRSVAENAAIQQRAEQDPLGEIGRGAAAGARSFGIFGAVRGAATAYSDVKEQRKTGAVLARSKKEIAKERERKAREANKSKGGTSKSIPGAAYDKAGGGILGVFAGGAAILGYLGEAAGAQAEQKTPASPTAEEAAAASQGASAAQASGTRSQALQDLISQTATEMGIAPEVAKALAAGGTGVGSGAAGGEFEKFLNSKSKKNYSKHPGFLPNDVIPGFPGIIDNRLNSILSQVLQMHAAYVFEKNQAKEKGIEDLVSISQGINGVTTVSGALSRLRRPVGQIRKLSSLSKGITSLLSSGYKLYGGNDERAGRANNLNRQQVAFLKTFANNMGRHYTNEQSSFGQLEKYVDKAFPAAEKALKKNPKQASKQIFSMIKRISGGNITANLRDIFNEAGGSDAYYRSGGGGIPGADTVPAMLTPGEFVMSKSAVDRHGVGFMRSLNRGQVQGFNKGGHVGGVQYLNDGSNGAVKENGNGNGAGGVSFDPTKITEILSQFTTSFNSFSDSFKTFSDKLTGLKDAFSNITMVHQFQGDMTLAFNITNKEALATAVSEAITGDMKQLIQKAADDAAKGIDTRPAT